MILLFSFLLVARKPESRVATNYAAIKNGFRAIFSYALLPLLSPKKLTLSGGPEEK